MSDAVYLTPGPSQPHPKLRQYLDEAWEEDIVAISHRSSAFDVIYRRTDAALRALLDIPPDYQIMFTGSATEAMERVIQGVVKSRSHHFVNGAFSGKWFEIAQQLGKNPTASKVEPGQSFSKDDFKVPGDTELVCVVQNETSTGAAFPDSDLLKLTKLPNKPLIALDVVSSAPLTVLPLEGLDLVFFSVQKAFGLPAGLGVLIASPRAIAKAEQLRAEGVSLGSYHSLPQLAAAAEKFQTPETPNVLGIYLLGRVADEFVSRGVSSLRLENQARAQIIYETLHSHDHLEPFIADPRWRSNTVAVTIVHEGSDPLFESLKSRGLVLGKGYSSYKYQHIRIANFPATDSKSFDRLVTHLKSYRPNTAKQIQ